MESTTLNKDSKRDAVAPIPEDEPLTLKYACEIIFKGQIKPATLKSEAKRGHLVIEQIGKKYFVTLAEINKMKERCRVQPKDQDCTFTSAKAAPQSGLSAMTTREFRQAAILATAARLKKSSRTTSRQNINQDSQAKILPLRTS